MILESLRVSIAITCSINDVGPEYLTVISLWIFVVCLRRSFPSWINTDSDKFCAICGEALHLPFRFSTPGSTCLNFFCQQYLTIFSFPIHILLSRRLTHAIERANDCIERLALNSSLYVRNYKETLFGGAKQCSREVLFSDMLADGITYSFC